MFEIFQSKKNLKAYLGNLFCEVISFLHLIFTHLHLIFTRIVLCYLNFFSLLETILLFIVNNTYQNEHDKDKKAFY